MSLILKKFNFKKFNYSSFFGVYRLFYPRLIYLKKEFFFNYVKQINTGFSFKLVNSLKFNWFKFNLFVGLGYKKKISKLKNLLYIYIADRHWLILPVFNFFTFTFRRRNFVLFSSSKTGLYYINNLLKELKKKNSFKVKGFFDVRTRRRWIVIRRVKVKGLITKLSKKQKLI